MKLTFACLALLHVLAQLSVAHPFVIINTHITKVQNVPSIPTHHYDRRQNLLDDITSVAASLLGIDSSPTSTTKKTSSVTNARKSSSTASASAPSSASARTIPPPVTASASTSSGRSAATSQSNDSETSDENDTSTSTVSEVSSTTESSSASTSISTSALSSTLSPGSSPTLGNSQATATSSSSSSNNNGGSVPPGGIAVAVIMSLLIVALIAWLVFKYHPKCQAWWAAYQEKRFQERSYRDAIDGPTTGSDDLRQQALSGSNSASRRQTILKSFFAPATAKLGGGQEIRRKPVNWGATSPGTVQTKDAEVHQLPTDSEKISMTASAAPMGQIERYSYLPPPPSKTPVSMVSPVSMHSNEDMATLPPVSPLSRRTTGQPDRGPPSLPPIPTLPELAHAKRGSDGVFRLK